MAFLYSLATAGYALCHVRHRVSGVAVDDYGNIVWSIDPAGGTTTWHVERVDESNEITSISCPSESRVSSLTTVAGS